MTLDLSGYESLVAQAIDFNTTKCTLKVMEVSTSHAPGEDAFKDGSFGPLYEDGPGVIYYVPETIEDLHEINPPAWLFPLLIKAIEHDFDYLKLDGCAQVFKDFKIYDW
jgi:hypothetical protein